MNDETHNGNSTVKKSNTSWHRLLAKLLEMILSPLDIDVQPDVSVMTDPPEADILLLRRKTSRWTEAQRARLPDGIRDSGASHILIEFKMTQSLNEKALAQAVGYDFFYGQAKELPRQELQTVLLSAKKPRSDTLTYLGYQQTEYPGVYRTQYPVIRNVLLLSLNELSNEPHNVSIKYFASRKNVKKQALNHLKTLGFISITHELQCFIHGLIRLWFGIHKGEQKMNVEFTPEEVTELGKQWGEVWLADLSVDDMLAHFGHEKVLSHFKPEEMLPHLKPEEVLPHFKPEVIENYLKQLKRQPK